MERKKKTATGCVNSIFTTTIKTVYLWESVDSTENTRNLYFLVENIISMNLIAIFKESMVLYSLFSVIAALALLLCTNDNNNVFIMEITSHLRASEIYSVFTIF